MSDIDYRTYWHNKQPTEPGWEPKGFAYWLRHSSEHLANILKVTRVCGEDYLLVEFGEREDDQDFLDNVIGEWCGPIRKPFER